MKTKSSELRKNYLLPRQLAQWIGCSEKKIRQYCECGKIPEAKRTPGGQWRFPRRVSQKTLAFLQFQAFRVEWPWIGKNEAAGESDDSDMAEGLMEAILFGKGAGESIPPYDEVDVGPAKNAAIADIQKLIWEKIKNKEPLSPFILSGSVYQFWLKNQRCPSVSAVAELMKISRSEFYRRGHSLAEIRAAYENCDPSRTELPSCVPADFGDDSDTINLEDQCFENGE